MNRVTTQSPTPRRARRRTALVPLLVGVMLVAGAIAPAQAATDWSRQKVATGLTKRLLDVAFADAATGVTVGQAGTIFRTSDGGASWTPVAAPLASDLRVVAASKACGAGALSCFWVGSAEGRMILSTDGGANWCAQETGSGERISGIFSASPDEVLAVGTNGTILRSTSARQCGAAAAYQQQDPAGVLKNLFSVTRTADGATVIVGAGGTILRQLNGGPWTPVSPSPTVSALLSVTVAHGGVRDVLWAVGEAGAIITSADSGATWSARTSPIRTNLNDVSFPVNQQSGFAVGDLGAIVSTADGGATWNGQTSSSCNNLFGLAMTDNNHGWASGGSGTMVVKPATGKGNQPHCGRTGLGYWLVATDGGIFSFGDASFQGSTGNIRLNQPIVGMAPSASGLGYWLVARDGGIFSFGDAAFQGSTGNIRLNQPIVGMAPTPTGAGYWLVASDGGIFSFGDAEFLGSTGNIKLTSPIVGMTSTPSGRGYWMVARDGGIFAFGDAKFSGSAGGKPVSSPIVAMATTPTGAGYWLAAADGQVFSFGDAKSQGAANGNHLTKPIVGMAATPTGAGYWLVASDGGIFAFGDAAFYGSTGAIKLNQPIVGMTNS
jgi:photosystem II stability/assembly factor-like uncharacterized protein